MSSITVLLLVLMTLMILVGGRQGWSAFWGLICNFCFLFLGIALMAFHMSPLIVLLIIGATVLAVTIFTGNDQSIVTITAFWSSLIILLIICLLILLINHIAMIQGFGPEESNELAGYSTTIGINFSQVAISSMTISSLGAIAEASIAISTGLHEVLTQHPDLNSRQLMISGYHIGQQIIGTTLNTLFFGLFGSALSLFIWFSQFHYSFTTIINNQILCQSLIEILVSFLGVLLVIPVTTIMAIRHH